MMFCLVRNIIQYVTDVTILGNEYLE